MPKVLRAVFAFAMLSGCRIGTVPDAEQFQLQAAVTGRPGWENLAGVAGVTWIGGSVQFNVGINLNGDEPLAIRTWHVHRGTCANPAEIMGDDPDYPRLLMDPDGSATQYATVPAQLNSAFSYYIDVHRSDTDQNILIACGNLVPFTG
jgi:hypothetical protein